MKTRTQVRQAEEIRKMLEAQTNEEEPQNDESSDSESDNEEELEGSDEDNLEEAWNSASEGDDSDDEKVIQEAGRVKRRRTSQSTASGTRSKFPYGQNRFNGATTARQVDGPCGVGAGASVVSEGAAWSLLLPDETLEKVVVHTNAAIARKRLRFITNPFTHSIDLCELKAFIGLLYFSGLQGSTRNIETLYGKLSSPIFRATMPRLRFEFILSVIRFDDKSTRCERRQMDKLAPIREIWDTFIGNSKSNFEPGQNVTIDGQLLSFRGRCAFRVCIKNKPDRYGMKIVTMNDSDTAYLIDAIPYVGRVAADPGESIPAHYVRKLSESIVGSNRNITCGSRFTSVPLVEKLKKETSLTLVGTIRKDERKIPEVMKFISEVRGSKFAYANNMTLVSHRPKKNKVVFLLSSLHRVGRASSDRNEPEIISHYNKTKGATDTFDKTCREYSVTRDTRRWPLRFFYGILDQSSINAFILFSLNKDNNLVSRREFNENLAYHLVTPLLLRRLRVSTLRFSVRALIEIVLGIDFTNNQLSGVVHYILDKQVRCAFCPRNKDKKTKNICSKCRLPRCQDHRSIQCTTCAPN